MRERSWSGDFTLSGDKQRPDLRGITLVNVNLSGALLIEATLAGAFLTLANLSGAVLALANLSEVYLVGAALTGADLTLADLTGANLSDATLSGTNLCGASMGANTTLERAKVDDKTRLGGVRWNSVPLTQVENWPERLGDEQVIVEAKDTKQRIHAYRKAARAYRGLSIALRGQGLLIPASNYRLREQVLECKALGMERKVLGWAFSWLLNLVAGYGERPVRSFFTYLLVLFSFAGVYLALGTGVFGLGSHDAISNPVSALVFSVTSFHGRGFFPGGLTLDDPITVLAAAEAVIGLFIEITFIATFTQRFFAR